MRSDHESTVHTIELNVFGVIWQIACPDRHTFDIVRTNFEALIVDGGDVPPARAITLKKAAGGRRVLHRGGEPPVRLADDYETIYTLEKTITIETQRLRGDLFFIHGAAVELHGRAALLIAPSGHGKSTTTWALVNRGFGYLSDELAPIELTSLTVAPYPHALCLKAEPPAPFLLPPATIRTRSTLHVPTAEIPRLQRDPVPVRAIFFTQFERASMPAVVPLGAGEAAALLYRNGLNQLAHERSGLKAAAQIAQGVQCFRLTTNDLEATCALVHATVTSIAE